VRRCDLLSALPLSYFTFADPGDKVLQQLAHVGCCTALGCGKQRYDDTANSGSFHSFNIVKNLKSY